MRRGVFAMPVRPMICFEKDGFPFPMAGGD